MTKVILQGHIVVPDSSLSAVLSELPAHIEATRTEEGCLTFDVRQDPKQRNVFEVYEEFVDRKAFEYHQERVKNSPWGDVTVGVERHYQMSGLYDA